MYRPWGEYLVALDNRRRNRIAAPLGFPDCLSSFGIYQSRTVNRLQHYSNVSAHGDCGRRGPTGIFRSFDLPSGFTRVCIDTNRERVTLVFNLADYHAIHQDWRG